MYRLTACLALTSIAFLTFAAVPVAADDCAEVNTATFSSGTRPIVNVGRQIAVGASVDDRLIIDLPGEGVGIVVIITPAACGITT